MKSFIFVIIYALFFVSFANCQCGVFVASDGTKYNTAALTTAIGYSGKEAGTSYTYYWNFCQNLATTTCFSPTPVTQVSPTGTCISLGYLNSAVLKDHPKGPREGFMLSYTNTLDNKCAGGTIGRNANIIVGCGDTEANVIAITEPGGDGACRYDIQMTSKHACAPHLASVSALSGGSIFLIIFLISFSLYFAIGSLVMWRVKGRSGVEAIPNYEFWRDLPGLIKDGFAFVRFKVTGYSAV
eukprot:TRINITY_DN3827_c0_g1_i1.p1 TRINITY_DN3827_c0_g1~~TRINITY_DN3827_c0_g1_i1.p1  ORF type:complete len:241 (-),score=35.65 TRINITY_DN3827_c0_g1_i1:13-735(-)